MDKPIQNADVKMDKPFQDTTTTNKQCFYDPCRKLEVLAAQPKAVCNRIDFCSLDSKKMGPLRCPRSNQI